MAKFLIYGGLFCILSFSNLMAQPTHKNYYESISEITHLLTQFNADKGSLRRFYIMPHSPERRTRFSTLVKDYQGRLNAMDFEKLGVNGQVDYLLLQRDLKEELKDLQDEEKQYRLIEPYFGSFNETIYNLERKRRRGNSIDAQQAALALNNVAKQITQQMEALKTAPNMDMPLAILAEQTALNLKLGLKSFYDFYYDYDPNFTWWLPKPYATVSELLTKYALALKEKGAVTTTQVADSSGIVGKPIGREELVRRLAVEMIPYSPEELVDIANKEFAWCDAEMLKASTAMGFGANWKDALEKVKNSYVPAGKQPEAIMKLYDESVDFLKKNKLLTIPPIAEESWRMIMMTPERQLVNPFFTGGEVLSISYPTSSMHQENKLMSMRGNNPHFSRATVHHELIAGHHLQAFMNDRYKNYRTFETAFWGEGWALYWEMLLWDMNFPQSAEDRVGMLFWRMHRCARIIFSLNYHLGKWAPQQCIDFLVNRVGHEKANAEGEVRRSFVGGYDPLYQIAYMIGGLQFMSLKKELVDNGKMTIMQFHDAVLQENTMPVEMVRAILTNQKLKKDFKTNWKFYKF